MTLTIVRVAEGDSAGTAAGPAGPSPLAQAAALFSRYREHLLSFDVPIDLFQGFADEIAALPGAYVARARGCILLAQLDGECVGCVALKDLGGGVAELAEVRAVGATDMAKEAGLEERTFLRRFKAATGVKPTEYAQCVRVEKARELLQFTRRPVDQVAWAVGYEDAAAFRRVFGRLVGLSPGDYRRRFGAEHEVAAAA